MSHQPERKEKNCLNCGTTVVGRYCHVCGQENIETKESFWHLVKHFVYDIFHFDGKFIHTVKYIFTKPGYIARQYVEGKRMSYLHPIRMYLFTSAIFFLIFFSFERPTSNDNVRLTRKDRREVLDTIEKELNSHPKDSSDLLILQNRLKDSSQEITNKDVLKLLKPAVFSIGKKKYTSLYQYDSIQRSLPDSSKDGWFMRKLVKKSIEFNEKYKSDINEGLKAFLEQLLHKLPYMLFLSLPFFALILKLLYRRRKSFYYSDHAVFTLYHYVFSFILLLLIFAGMGLQSLLNWGFLTFLITILSIAWPVYLYIEMKNFYRQGWLKTFVKFVVLDFLGILVVMILFVIFLFFSFFQF